MGSTHRLFKPLPGPQAAPCRPSSWESDHNSGPSHRAMKRMTLRPPTQECLRRRLTWGDLFQAEAPAALHDTGPPQLLPSLVSLISMNPHYGPIRSQPLPCRGTEKETHLSVQLLGSQASLSCDTNRSHSAPKVRRHHRSRLNTGPCSGF